MESLHIQSNAIKRLPHSVVNLKRINSLLVLPNPIEVSSLEILAVRIDTIECIAMLCCCSSMLYHTIRNGFFLIFVHS